MSILMFPPQPFWIYWTALFSFGCGILAGGILADLIFNMYFKTDETRSDESYENKFRKECRNKLLVILFIVGVIVVLLVCAMIVTNGTTG